MRASYFLGNRLLASTDKPALWSEGEPSSHSIAFLCPECGELWGRVVVADAESWLPVRRGCIKHPWIDTVGGSFIASWRTSFSELPPEVLKYELEIRLKDYPNES